MAHLLSKSALGPDVAALHALAEGRCRDPETFHLNDPSTLSCTCSRFVVSFGVLEGFYSWVTEDSQLHSQVNLRQPWLPVSGRLTSNFACLAFLSSSGSACPMAGSNPACNKKVQDAFGNSMQVTECAEKERESAHSF